MSCQTPTTCISPQASLLFFKGEYGPMGATGPIGPKGNDGEAGGPPGVQGATGVAGATGPAGATGATGGPGSQGATGATGTSARQILTGNRVYYVRIDGDDANTGLLNTAGGAFLTIQKAIDTLAAIDFAGYTATIRVADGTYTGGIQVSGTWIGSTDIAAVEIIGNNSVPENVIISTTGEDAIRVSNYGDLAISGLMLQTATSGNGISVQSGSTVHIAGLLSFGVCAENHISANDRSSVQIESAYNIRGAAISHWTAKNFSLIGGSVYTLMSGQTVTCIGTPALTQYFAHAASGSLVSCAGFTFIGSATGARYLAELAGIVNTETGDIATLPGNSVGSVATNGLYT